MMMDSSPAATGEAMNETDTGNSSSTINQTESTTPYLDEKSRDAVNVTASKKPLHTSTDAESASVHQEHSYNVLNDTSTENVTEAPNTLLTALLSPDLIQNSDAFDGSGDINDTPIKSALVSPRPDYKQDTWNKTSAENVTEDSVILLSAHEARDVFTVTDSEKLQDKDEESESVSLNEDHSLDTLSDSTAENVTDGSLRLLTAPLSADQNSDTFNHSGAVIDAPMKSDSSHSHQNNNSTLNSASSEKWTKIESPTAHPTDSSRDVTDSEKLLDTNMEAESVLFHQDVSHGTLNKTEEENATDAPLTVLSAPLSEDQNSDSFNNRETITDTPMKRDESHLLSAGSQTPHPTENSRDVTEKLVEKSMDAESVSSHRDDSHDTLSGTKTEKATEAPVKLSVPLSEEQNSDSFNNATEAPIKLFTDTLSALNNSGNIINTPMKSDSSYPLQTNNEINVTTNDRWKKTECIIKNIKCSEKATKMQSTYGAWMFDASRRDDGRFWLADHFSGRVLVEHRNISSFPDSSGNIIDVRKFFQGCGHVVYRQSFYFHNAGTNRLIKFDLNTRRTNSLIMANSRYHNLTYLFPNSKTYFKFAVDENGLWVLFASDTDDDTMVAKISPDTFFVESVINTHYPKSKAGNAFIVCGVLYFTDDKDRRVAYAFDLKRESPLDANFDLRPDNGILAMLSYYPNKKLLYMWDNSSVKICKVRTKLI